MSHGDIPLDKLLTVSAFDRPFTRDRFSLKLPSEYYAVPAAL